MSTLAEIVADVRDRIGETTEYDFFTQARITAAINEGLRRFSNEERWPWLYSDFSATTAIDDSEVALPSEIALNRVFALNIEDATLVGGQMLERVTPEEGFRLRHAYRNTSALPRWYYISKSNLAEDDEAPVYYTAKMIPTPDLAYEITGIYLFVPPLLSSDTDVPAMPDEYQAALPAYAAGLLFLKEMEISQKASEQFAIYNSILANALRETKRFDADEVVAWGRSKPSGRGRGFDSAYTNDVLGRVAPTIG